MKKSPGFDTGAPGGEEVSAEQPVAAAAADAGLLALQGLEGRSARGGCRKGIQRQPHRALKAGPDRGGSGAGGGRAGHDLQHSLNCSLLNT
jgi:hypothetical protein